MSSLLLCVRVCHIISTLLGSRALSTLSNASYVLVSTLSHRRFLNLNLVVIPCIESLQGSWKLQLERSYPNACENKTTNDMNPPSREEDSNFWSLTSPLSSTFGFQKALNKLYNQTLHKIEMLKYQNLGASSLALIQSLDLFLFYLVLSNCLRQVYPRENHMKFK